MLNDLVLNVLAATLTFCETWNDSQALKFKELIISTWDGEIIWLLRWNELESIKYLKKLRLWVHVWLYVSSVYWRQTHRRKVLKNLCKKITLLRLNWGKEAETLEPTKCFSNPSTPFSNLQVFWWYKYFQFTLVLFQSEAAVKHK